jgi:hypothetical protein
MYRYNDGGRSAAGRAGLTNDCVTRAIAIVTSLPYLQVYDALAEDAHGNARPAAATASAGTAAPATGST